MLITKTVMVKWNSSNKKWYESKGYIFTKWKDEFEVKVEDLSNGSHIIIELLYDYCNKTIIPRIYKDYINYKKKSPIEKDCCVNCRSIKVKESNNLVYGVSNISELESVVQKRKETNLKNYGVESYLQTQECKDRIKQTNLLIYNCENPMQNLEVQQKSKNTTLEKYGVEYYSQTEKYKQQYIETSLLRYGTIHPMQNNEIKNKTALTNLERYGSINVSSNSTVREKVKETVLKKWGVEYIGQSLEIQNKIKQTINDRYDVDYYFQTEEFKIQYINIMMDKYGVDNSFKSEEVKEKISKAKYNNNDIVSSKQQKYICDLLKGKLNYPIGSCNLDIAFPEEKIYIEYDGSGHDLSIKFGNETIEEFEERTKRRWYYLNKLGWKEIRIISLNDKLPLDEKISEIIQYAKKYFATGHSWIKFDIDNSKIINHIEEKEYNFGELRRIYKQEVI